MDLSHRQWKELDDDALLTRARRDDGDEARRAASVLLERYGERVYCWCFRYARDHDGALDLAQQTLLRAYQRLSTFEGRSQFSSWLFAVTRSTCLNSLQKVKLHADPEFDLDRIVDTAAGPEADLESREDRERYLRVIREVLDEQEQEAMILRYFEYFSPDEITRMLDLGTQSGARGLLQRARRKLIAALGPGGSHGA